MFLVKWFVFFNSIICPIIILGQNTNVVLPCLIDSKNLKIDTFQNGDKLELIYEKNDPEYYFWNKNINKPSILITKTGDFLYNYRSVSDNRNLCPINKHLANSYDISKHYINCNSIINNVNFLEFIPSCSEPAYYNIQRETQLLLLSDPISLVDSYSSELQKMETNQVIKIYNFKESDILPLPTYSGGALRCAYDDYKLFFSNGTHSFEKLLPTEYNFLKSKIYKSVENYHNLSQNDLLNIEVELYIDSLGRNLSSIKSSNPKYSNLEERILNIARELRVYPYFEDVKIKSKSTIQIDLHRFSDEVSYYVTLNRTNLNRFQIKNINDYDIQQNLESCINEDFKFKYKTVRYIVKINGLQENNSSENYLYNVRTTKGPAYSLLSFIPGLGQVNVKSYNTPGLKMWHISVPIGAIAIASKIYSNFYYSQYLSDLDGSNSRKNYTNANVSQKVFLTSLGLYSIMSLVDFGITFTIGCKNKALQSKVNRKLKDF
jgi:hypothetical protein